MVDQTEAWQVIRQPRSGNSSVIPPHSALEIQANKAGLDATLLDSAHIGADNTSRLAADEADWCTLSVNSHQ